MNAIEPPPTIQLPNNTDGRGGGAINLIEHIINSGTKTTEQFGRRPKQIYRKLKKLIKTK